MCDYCDCRSHPAIASLSQDHEILLGLLTGLRRAVAADDAKEAGRLAAEVHGLLPHHAAKEEAGVFTQLRAVDVDPHYVAAFEDDHDRIHRLSAAADPATWQADALALADVLQGHIEREEYDLFPSAHQLLAPTNWDAVDAVHTDLNAQTDR